MTDYSFMRTGFNTSVDEEETDKNAISVIVAFSEGALNTAAIYLSHGDRKAVTPEDLKRGMMLEMFLFKHRDDALEKAQKIKEELFGEQRDELDQKLDDDHYDEDDEIFIENTCVCGICKCINNIYTRWNNFEPSTPFETIFQKHINNMC